MVDSNSPTGNHLPAGSEVKSVSRFEANLLQILQHFFDQVDEQLIRSKVIRPMNRPRCLSSTCVVLIKDILAKGCVKRLAAGGGWRQEKRLRNDDVKEGRIWDLTSPDELGFSFSEWTIEFLIWMTAEEVFKDKAQLLIPADELTLGDQLVMYFAYESLRETDIAETLRNQSAFITNGLCWLMFPADFAERWKWNSPFLEPWISTKETSTLGICVIECFQPLLQQRWMEVERRKGRITNTETIRQIGQAQADVLTDFLNRIEQINRLDLCRFLLKMLDQFLQENTNAKTWIGLLNVKDQRLADRMETYQLALTLLHHFQRLRRWEQNARSTAFFDEGYAASQLWKADWERYRGNELIEKIDAILREVQPLQA